MSMMYKIFYSILAAGALGGALFSLWALLFTKPTSSTTLFVGLTTVLGLVYGFVNYIFIKAVLRIFVRKFHALERVLVGTEPSRLPNVFLSNEIDEIEASMVRVTDQFNRIKDTKVDRRTGGSSMVKSKAFQTTPTEGGPRS